MNTQAIKIIDEMIKKLEKSKNGHSNKDLTGVYVHEKANLRIETLEEAKERISSLHSIDIDSLQRYSCWIDEWYQPNMNKSDDWEYIRYDDLLNLLKNDK